MNLPAVVDAARALASRLFAAHAAAQADALAPLGDLEGAYFRAAFAAEWERLRREAEARRVRVTVEGTDGSGEMFHAVTSGPTRDVREGRGQGTVGA